MVQFLKAEYINGTFQIREIIDENGETYILEGECCNCGKCCLDPRNNVGFNDETGSCSKLMQYIENDITKYKCSIYSTRPAACMLWPTEIEEIARYPECTLKIIKKIQ